MASPRETLEIAAAKSKKSCKGAVFRPINLFRQIRDKQTYMRESLRAGRSVNIFTV
jgi:hypothetical protein